MWRQAHALVPPHPPYLPAVLLTALVCSQVFGDGPDAVKQSLEGVFDGPVADGKVKTNVRFSRKVPQSASA